MATRSSGWLGGAATPGAAAGPPARVSDGATAAGADDDGPQGARAHASPIPRSKARDMPRPPLQVRLAPRDVGAEHVAARDRHDQVRRVAVVVLDGDAGGHLAADVAGRD